MEQTSLDIDSLLGQPKGQLRRLRQNLFLSGVSIVITAIIGFILSFPANLFLNNEAANYKLGGSRSIETSKLIAYERSQRVIVLFFACVGALSAQVVFVVRLRGQATIAEPCTAPNGGPVTSPGNSGVTEGPPSVS